MKKKLALLGVLGLFGLGFIGAAPSQNNFMKFIGASVTIDSQFTATQWELIDSIIIIKTDTCYTLYTVTGVAVMNPEDKLYLGFDDGGGSGGLPVDTFLIQPSKNSIDIVRIPFVVRYLDSLLSSSTANDTIYVYGAVGGSAGIEKVQIEDGLFTAQVFDYDTTGFIGE